MRDESFDWNVAVGAGNRAKSLVQTARKNRRRVLAVAADRPRFPVDRFLRESVQSVDAAEKIREKLRIQPRAILCRSSGAAVVVAAQLAEAFGLPGYSMRVALAAYQKNVLFKTASSLGVATIPCQQIKEIAELPRDLEGPIVVKPDIPLVGKLGVSVVETREQLTVSVQSAQENSKNGRAIVQPYLAGEELGLAMHLRQESTLWSYAFAEDVRRTRSGFESNAYLKIDKRKKELLQPRLEQSAKRFLLKSGFSGFAVFSFLQRHSGSTPLLFEINLGLAGDGLLEEHLMPNFPDIDFLQTEFEIANGLEGP